MSNYKEFVKGIVKENPVLVTMLGMCPTLAVTTMAANAIGMGAATTFVLVCSNIVIASLKDFIPKQVRLPAYITIIAGFVTIISLLMKSLLPELYKSLGLFLSLITVNCIILGRAEVFASKNKIVPAIMDGLGMGVGFTLALLAMGSVREILGTGEWFGITVKPDAIEPMLIFIFPAGGFFTLGIIIAVINKIAGKTPPAEISCANCSRKDSCVHAVCEVSDAEKTTVQSEN